jgi:hypothetical protein
MTRRSLISTRSLPLWASAFVLGGILLALAGRLPENPAYAGMATTGTGGFTLVTDASGYGPDTRPYEILYVLDNTTQTLFVYSIERAADKRIMLRDGRYLPSLFRTARGG